MLLHWKKTTFTAKHNVYVLKNDKEETNKEKKQMLNWTLKNVKTTSHKLLRKIMYY